MKNKKLILLAFVLIVLIIGGTYSAYNWTYTSTNPNTLSTNALEVKFLESNSEIINLTNALPMSDEEGKLEQSFDFAVTSKTISDVAIGYNLKIEKLELDTGYTAFQDNQMKIYLTDYNDNVLLEPTKISELNNYKFYTGTQIHDSSHEMVQDKFKLRAWIDESVSTAAQSWDLSTKLQYKFKIGVSANETNQLHTVNVVVNNGIVNGEASKKVAAGTDASFNITPNEAGLGATVYCTNNQNATYSNNKLTVNNVTSDTTCTVNLKSYDTVLYNDGTLIINQAVSQSAANIEKHGNVIREYEALSNSNQYVFDADGYCDYTWWCSEESILSVEIGTIIRPVSTANWFSYLRNMKSGNFENLDTSQVVDMHNMFFVPPLGDASTLSDVSNFVLEGLDDWDTSSVTNMFRMFDGAGYNATTWSIGDLSNWDTSSVTDMRDMFKSTGSSATTWSIGDLSNWDTSSVTDMSGMFLDAGVNATTFDIDLSNWDTSKVTDMESMFANAGAKATTWSIGNLSNWDTSNVTDMSSMFSNAGHNHNNDNFSINGLSNWDTSNVTDMSYMFSSAGEEATAFELNLSDWDTSKVTDMEYMFANAGAKATTWSIGDLSNWDTSNVESMSYMFAMIDCVSDMGSFRIYDANMSSIFYNSKLNATINIYGNPMYYEEAFSHSTGNITVNYSSATTNIDNIIATSDYDNVVKGSLLD